MSRNPLGRLHDLAVFVGTEEDPGDHVGELVDLAAAVMEAGHCSIMLVVEGGPEAQGLKLWGSSGDLPHSAGSETSEVGAAIAERVLDRNTSVLIPDLHASDFAALARQHDIAGASVIGTPIVLGKQVIGVMNLASRLGAPPFDDSDLRLAEIVATLVAKCIQVERLQTLLRSRVAQISLAKEQKAVVAQLTGGTVPPARVAKLLAKSFFRDLSSAGFDPGQIIEAASEIITLVSSDIHRFKKRIQRMRK